MKVLLSQIDVSKNPIREAYNMSEIDKLMNSIKLLGLLNPVCLKSLQSERFEILAGNKRYSACKKLGFKDIEAVVVCPKNPYEEFLYTLHENEIRENITWQERILATKREKILYEQIYPNAAKPGGDRKSKRNIQRNDIPSFTETKADMEGISQRKVQADIELAEDIVKYPEIGAELSKGAAISKLKELKQENKIKEGGDMGKLEIMRHRNDSARLIRFSNRNHRNCIRFSQAESLAHLLRKAEICYNLNAEGKEFLTEAVFENGSRADVFVLDDCHVIEICCSEEVSNCKLKAGKYPVSDVEFVKIGGEK